MQPPRDGGTPPQRIRSFVKREGRLTPAQARALEELLPRWGVPFAPAPLDFTALFGREAPRVVEVGFGAGEALLAHALAHPETDHLGIEVHRPGVGRLLRAVASHGLTNVRVSTHDAVEVLAQQVPSASLDAVLLLFPDPWPKKRHHKRRIVQPEFAALVADRLKRDGGFVLATDWAPYAEHMRTVLDACAALAPAAADARRAPRVATRFEERGLRLGHEVFDLDYRRV